MFALKLSITTLYHISVQETVQKNLWSFDIASVSRMALIVVNQERE